MYYSKHFHDYALKLLEHYAGSKEKAWVYIGVKQIFNVMLEIPPEILNIPFYDPRIEAEKLFPFINQPQIDSLIWGYTRFPYCTEKEYIEDINKVHKAMDNGTQVCQILEEAASNENNDKTKTPFDKMIQTMTQIGIKVPDFKFREGMQENIQKWAANTWK